MSPVDQTVMIRRGERRSICRTVRGQLPAGNDRLRPGAALWSAGIVGAAFPGPIIGLGLILLRIVPLDFAGYVSSLIYAIVYPNTGIASTLSYL